MTQTLSQEAAPRHAKMTLKELLIMIVKFFFNISYRFRAPLSCPLFLYVPGVQPRKFYAAGLISPTDWRKLFRISYFCLYKSRGGKRRPSLASVVKNDIQKFLSDTFAAVEDADRRSVSIPDV